MFGSVVLDVALGLVLSFLLLSLILTSVQEGIESLLKGRAKDLERAIGELLDKGADATIVKTFYDHPLISPLFPKAYKEGGGNLPSYIPGASFAAAVSDIANKVALAVPGAKSGGTAATPTQRITDAYKVANQLAGGSAADTLKGLEAWYDSAMARLSGKYKRKTQMWLFSIGLLVAALGNINPINIAEHIAKDQKVSASVVALATSIQNQQKVNPDNAPNAIAPAVAKQIQDQLSAGLPVGWGDKGSLIKPPDDFNWGKAVAGWLIAALAGMLGAPFWFDQLNRIMNLRASPKPDAKKPA
jgi:hypothetical protein